jgi:hypothetical protein
MFKGGDVRLATGSLTRPDIWPRKSLKAAFSFAQSGILIKLGDRKIAIRTLKRCSVAMERLLCWIGALYSDFPDDAVGLEELLCEWGEYCWNDSAPEGFYDGSLSTVLHSRRGFKGKIPEAWQLLGVGIVRITLPCSPLPPATALCYGGVCLTVGDISFAAVLMAASQRLLRTSEAFGLKVANVMFRANGDAATLFLGMTRNGQRQGRLESLLINDKNTLGLLELPVEGKRRGDSIVDRKIHAIRKFYPLVSDELEPGNCGFQLYSLRRGGSVPSF